MGSYSGNLKHGCRHGSGLMVFSNGDVYDGEWKRGLMDGSGTMRYSNGDMYSGQFLKGLYSGQGVLHWANGDVYNGRYKRGQRHGHGTMRYRNFDEYSGEWREDAQDGFGVYRYAGGDRFSGHYKGGAKHGPGEYLYKSGDRYRGGFINDKYSGRGVYVWAGGASYEGDYICGKRNGFGVYTSEAGVYEGEWKDGHWNGYGIFRYPDGETKMGRWEKDQLKQQLEDVPRHVTAIHNAFLLDLKRERDNAARSAPPDAVKSVRAQRSRVALREQWDSRPAADILKAYADMIELEPTNSMLLADRAAFYEHLANKAYDRQENLYKKALDDFSKSLSLNARDADATYGHARISSILSGFSEKARGKALPVTSKKKKTASAKRHIK